MSTLLDIFLFVHLTLITLHIGCNPGENFTSHHPYNRPSHNQPHQCHLTLLEHNIMICYTIKPDKQLSWYIQYARGATYVKGLML